MSSTLTVADVQPHPPLRPHHARAFLHRLPFGDQLKDRSITALIHVALYTGADVRRYANPWKNRVGRSADFRELLPLVYAELRQLAESRMAAERSDMTLQATALVHEAYVRLVDVEIPQQWKSRRHFFAAAAEAMRRILVERARKRNRREELRGPRIPLGELRTATDCPPDQFLILNDALSRLEAENSTAAAMVKLRFFAGLTVSQAASTLEIPVRTAERKWAFARTWLHRELENPAS